MNCHFAATSEPRVYRCTQCGRVLRSATYAPDRCYALCGATSVHRIPATEHAARMAACQSCPDHEPGDRCRLLRGCDLALKRRLRPDACKRLRWPAAGGLLPLEDAAVRQGECGLVTGGQAVHWPCLGALAIAAARQGLGLAVADHGLHAWQRAELERAGVALLEHERPPLAHADVRPQTIAHLHAWWKPWICLASPYPRSLWIDADAVAAGDLAGVFRLLELTPLISTQDRFAGTGERLYLALFEYLYGRQAAALVPAIAAINTGVLGWRRGDAVIAEWAEASARLLADPAALKICNVRDQSAYAVALAERLLAGRPLPLYLPDRYNWPADGLPMARVKQRRSVPAAAAELLAETRRRHPGAVVVHWLGRGKPWELAAGRAAPPRPARPAGEPLAVLVPYYNFSRSVRRRENYRRTVEALERLGCQVWTAEAALAESDFELPLGPRLTRYRVDQPMWHKETLINLTLRRLPAEITAVAWLDADVLFDRDDLVQATRQALRQWPLVQMFQDVRWLDAAGQPRAFDGGGNRQSLAHRQLRLPSPLDTDHYWPGMAWAARRDVLERMGGLYDGFPFGSADVLAAAGCYGRPQAAALARYGPAVRQHWWTTWGQRAAGAVGGRVGCVAGTLTHLYHGEIRHRQYLRRLEVIRAADYDPTSHQERDEQGCWRLAAPCPPAVREWIAEYLLTLRREDG